MSLSLGIRKDDDDDFVVISLMEDARSSSTAINKSLSEEDRLSLFSDSNMSLNFCSFLSRYSGVQKPTISRYTLLPYFSNMKSGMKATLPDTINGSGSLISFQPVDNGSTTS